METTLFDNTNLTIQYIDTHEYLLLKWNGFAKGSYFKFLADQILQAVEKTKTKRILSDNTHWQTISPNDQGWAANYWFPKAEEKGIRKMATVSSTNLFNRIAERSIEGMADVDCIQIKNFQSMQDAEAWLTNPPESKYCKPE